MPLSSAYALVGISHICAEVKTFITIRQNLFFFRAMQTESGKQ